MRVKLLLSLLVCFPFAALQAMERCVWREEFNGSKLNTAYWTPEVNFVRNIEAVQIYTDRPENLTVKKGLLHLTSRHEHFESTDWKPESSKWWESRKSAEYTSGSINSRGKVAFRYGRVEIRARVEHGRGVWPALWLIGNNPGGWPACGEIDILEYVSQNPKTVHVTCHYQKDGTYIHPTRQHDGVVMDKKWHIYGLEWTPEKIVISLDKKPVYTLNLDDTVDSKGYSPFRSGTFHLILNQALGGWAEKPHPEDYPKTFAIDYVRLYQDTAQKESLLEVAPAPNPAKPAVTRKQGPVSRPASSRRRVKPKGKK